MKSYEPVLTFQRSGTKVIALSIGIAIGIVTVTASITAILLSVPREELGRLSDAGQAFGIVSAVLSGAAFAGVVASVAYQSRQNRHYRFEMWHTAHVNLLYRVLDEPATYGPCIGDMSQFDSDDEIRRFFFTTLWLNFGQIGWDSGNFTEESIRNELCAEMFASPIARALWLKRRAGRVQAYGGLSPFYAMIDEEFRKSTLRHYEHPDAVDDSQGETPTPAPDVEGSRPARRGTA